LEDTRINKIVGRLPVLIYGVGIDLEYPSVNLERLQLLLIWNYCCLEHCLSG